MGYVRGAADAAVDGGAADAVFIGQVCEARVVVGVVIAPMDRLRAARGSFGVPIGDLRSALTEIRMNSDAIEGACARLREIQQERRITGIAHGTAIDDCRLTASDWNRRDYAIVPIQCVLIPPSTSEFRRAATTASVALLSPMVIRVPVGYCMTSIPDRARTPEIHGADAGVGCVRNRKFA